MLETPQASVAVAVPVAEGSVDSEHSTVTLAGTDRIGATVSTTDIVCVAVEAFPQESNAVQVLVTE